MPENLFTRIKHTLRELQQQDWEYVEADEAAARLVTYNGKYSDTGHHLHDVMQPHRLEAALAGFFSEEGFNLGIKEMPMPDDIGHHLFYNIVYDLLARHYVAHPANRAYSDFDFDVTRDPPHVMSLIAADRDVVDLAPAMEKLDFLKASIPRAFTVFKHGGKEWVRPAAGLDELTTHTACRLIEQGNEQRFGISEKGEYTPIEANVRGIPEDSAGHDLLMAYMEHLHTSDEELKKIHLEPRPDDQIAHHAYCGALEKSEFLKVMASMGIDCNIGRSK